MLTYAISSSSSERFFKTAKTTLNASLDIVKMLRHPLILLAFVDVTVGIVFFEGFYVSAKGRVTCFDRPDHSAIVSIVYRGMKGLKCRMGAKAKGIRDVQKLANDQNVVNPSKQIPSRSEGTLERR